MIFLDKEFLARTLNENTSLIRELDESLKDWQKYQNFSVEELKKDRDKKNMALHAMLVSIQVAIDVAASLISKRA
jgi:uncharacterized protein YutE (UPF0331/DUF86 family)